MRRVVLSLGIAMLAGGAPTVPLTAQQSAARPSDAAMLADMVGTWDVEQRMWTGPTAKPVVLPPAVAERRIPAGGGYLVETMTPADGGGETPFTRTAYLNYNAIDGVFEYFSLDSRMPQQMRYGSQPLSPDARAPLALSGGAFTAPKWGDKRNIAFRYRVEIDPVRNGRQRFALFLRPLETGQPREFLAFQYIYTKRR